MTWPFLLSSAILIGSAVVTAVLSVIRRDWKLLPAALFLAAVAGVLASASRVPGEGVLAPSTALVAAVLSIAVCILLWRTTDESRRMKRKAEALEKEVRRISEEASSHVEASKSHFRHLTEIIPQVILEADLSGECVFVSRRWVEMTGMRRSLAKGRGWLQAVHCDDRPRVEQEWFSGIEEQRTFEVEFRLESRAPEPTWVSLQAVPRSKPHDEEITYIGTLDDITERKSAEEERRRLEERSRRAQKLESLGVLAGGIAHDFNNLLVGIVGSVELLEDRLSTDADGLHLLGVIQRSAHRAGDLASQMLAYAGKGVRLRQPLDLSDVADDVVALLRDTSTGLPLIETDLARDLPPIHADTTQLRQVIRNLIQNAVEASVDSDSARILVSTGIEVPDEQQLSDTYLEGPLPAGDYVFLEVADQGVGIGPEDMERVFDPFFSTKFTGRGLGLAVVLGAVHANDGVIRVDSEQGSGTTVRVWFPGTERAELETTSSEAAAKLTRGEGHVLVIDDDEVTRDTVVRILARAGYDPLAARSGEEGVEVFRSRSSEIRAVLLDMTMPDICGDVVLRKLREIEKETPVLILSGHAEKDVMRSFQSGELAGFIAKPFRREVLLRMLDTAIRIGGPSENSLTS